MSAIDRNLIRSLAAVAGTALLAGTAMLGSAFAQGADREANRPEGVEILEDEDVEEGEEEDEVPWALSAAVNRAVLVWNDGRASGAYSVDNSHDLLLEGEIDLGRDWTLGLNVGLYTLYASADLVDQRDRNGYGFEAGLDEAFLEIGHDDWGSVAIGQMDSASDDIDDISLAGSDTVADASVDNWIGSFFLRAAGTSGRAGAARAFGPESAELRWGDFLDGSLAGETGRFLTYRAPEVRGFEISASLGQPQEIAFARTDAPPDEPLFYDRENGAYRDIALRYSAEWDDLVRIEAGIGLWRDTTEEDDAEEPREDSGLGGSIAARHIPTGLNIAVSAGMEDHADECARPGAVTGRCRGADRFVYVKGGLVRDDADESSTSFYGEFYRGWKAHNESDADVLRALGPRFARELAGSTATVWGFGVTREIRSAAELYVGYRHYALDVDLLGAAGPVPARRLRDLDAVMAGMTIEFGD